MICPKCGHELDYQWDVTNGVWKKCTYCDFETIPEYTTGDHIPVRNLDRIYKSYE